MAGGYALGPYYYSNLRTEANQNTLTTGQALTGGQLAGITQGELEARYNANIQEQQIANQQNQYEQTQAQQTGQFNQQMALANQEYADKKSAAKMQGIEQLAVGGASILASAPKIISGVDSVGSALGIGGGVATGTAAISAPTALSAAGAGVDAAGTTGYALTGTGVADAGVTASGAGITAAGSDAAASSLSIPGVGETVGVAAVGGYIGSEIGKQFGNTGKAVGSVLGAAATGAEVGSMILPGIGTAVGSVIGGIVGGIESLFGSVICTELYRQGKIKKGMWILCQRHGNTVSSEDYIGYRIWADPVVRLMRRSRVANALIVPLARQWAYAVAAKESRHIKPSLLGKALYSLSVGASRISYSIKVGGEDANV